MASKSFVERLELTLMGRSDKGGDFTTKEGEVKEYADAYMFSFFDDEGNIGTVTYRLTGLDKVAAPGCDVAQAKPGEKFLLVTEYVLFENKDGRSWFQSPKEFSKAGSPVKAAA